MYKFKASKFKNAAPTIVKKEECITDVTVETPMTFGNFVAASVELLAFCSGPAGSGKVMVLDVEAKGRIGNGPVLNAHSDCITALEFSPFNHCQLATAGADNTVKIWDLPSNGITEVFNSSPVVKFLFPSRPECIAFNPVAANILAIGCGSKLMIGDVGSGEIVLEMDVGCDLIESISWKKDGTFVAVTSKDCLLSACNPRGGAILAKCVAHDNHKESRVAWIGETDAIFTTGFSSVRGREVKVFTFANGSLSCTWLEEFSTGPGVLMPFYDEDTGMLLLSAKGDSNVYFLEYFENKKPPLQMATSQLMQNQTKGMAALPKLAVKAAQGEVNRLYQLSQKLVVPIPWIVPRRSLRDFPAELFPDAASDEPALTSDQWFNGQITQRNRTSLDPAKRAIRSRGDAVASKQTPPVKEIVNDKPKEAPAEVKVAAKEAESQKAEDQAAPVVVKPKYKPFTGVRQSKFRHWKSKVAHPSSHVTKIDSILTSVYPSGDLLKCSDVYAAIPLKGPGGKIAIIQHSNAGRMSDSNSIMIENSKTVVDMQWNPFDPSQIAFALESSDITVWRIPAKKTKEPLQQADLTFSGHYSKPVALCYHPLAENVIASGDVDGKIIVWDVVTGDTYFELSCNNSEVMSMAWSQSGKYLATSSKDKMLRVFEPRKSTDVIQIGASSSETRSSRLVWACDDKFVVISGFDMGSRMVYLHVADDLTSGPVSCLEFADSPSVLTMHYDIDSSTLFFIGKGDLTMHSAEVSEAEPPHLFQLSSQTFDSSVHGVSFLSKKNIDPRKVEFAQAWSLTKSSLHELSFTIPRVKMEYFQDDLFPPTPVTWEKTLSASEWIRGADKIPKKKNIKPAGMTPLSAAPPDEVKPKKYQSYDAATYKTDEEKKEELLEAMSGKLDLDKQLEQDTMEGVDEDEWDDY